MPNFRVTTAALAVLIQESAGPAALDMFLKSPGFSARLHLSEPDLSPIVCSLGPAGLTLNVLSLPLVVKAGEAHVMAVEGLRVKNIDVVPRGHMLEGRGVWAKKWSER